MNRKAYIKPAAHIVPLAVQSHLLDNTSVTIPVNLEEEGSQEDAEVKQNTYPHYSVWDEEW